MPAAGTGPGFSWLTPQFACGPHTIKVRRTGSTEKMHGESIKLEREPVAEKPCLIEGVLAFRQTPALQGTSGISNNAVRYLAGFSRPI